MKCFFCDKPANNVKYMVIPGHIMVPNSYLLCEDHDSHRLSFEDIYNENGSRKWPPAKFIKISRQEFSELYPSSDDV